MLVRFEDIKGKPVWINPIHVRMLREKRGVTEIRVAQTPGSSPFLKVRMPLDQVADLLNSAMPDMAYVPDDETNTTAQQAAAAGAAAALLG